MYLSPSPITGKPPSLRNWAVDIKGGGCTEIQQWHGRMRPLLYNSINIVADGIEVGV